MTSKHNLNEHEFKISQIEILALVREKLAKWLKIELDLVDVNEKFIDDVEKLFTEHKGKCRVKFSISDSAEQIKIDLPSNGNGINVTNELLFALEEMKLGYEILT